MLQKIVDNSTQWVERYGKTEESIILIGPPFILLLVMDTLQKEGKSFDFGERGEIETGGGWKIYENKRIPRADFRRQVQDVLGIPETRCLDSYAMVNGNGWCSALKATTSMSITRTTSPSFLTITWCWQDTENGGALPSLMPAHRATLALSYRATECACSSNVQSTIGRDLYSSWRSNVRKARRCVGALRNTKSPRSGSCRVIQKMPTK